MTDVDLFGNSLPEKIGRGRPLRVFSKQEQWLVVSMLRYGATVDEICEKVGCSAPTLRRHYFKSPFWNQRGCGAGQARVFTEADLRLADQLAADGAKAEEIAAALGTSVTTLRRRVLRRLPSWAARAMVPLRRAPKPSPITDDEGNRS